MPESSMNPETWDLKQALFVGVAWVSILLTALVGLTACQSAPAPPPTATATREAVVAPLGTSAPGVCEMERFARPEGSTEATPSPVEAPTVTPSPTHTNTPAPPPTGTPTAMTVPTPDAELVPMLLTGASDTRFYRDVGAQAYGFSLFDDKLKLAEIAALAHGDDERISIGTLRLTAEVYERLARNFLGGDDLPK